MKIQFSRWLAYCLLTLICWGVFGLLSKIGSNELSPEQMQIAFTAGMSLLVVPALVHSKIGGRHDRLGLLYGTLIGLFAGIANVAVFAALRTGEVSLVQPVTALYPLVTVVLAFVVLKERMNRVQITGVAFALIAIVILSS